MGIQARLTSLCCFSIISFTSDLGPQENGVEGKDAMAKGSSGARKVRKMRTSRDGWKERAAKKQQEIKRLRGTVRDLTVSRDHWKTRVNELEQQLEALQHDITSASCLYFLFGG
jgi:chromosome segregation ATPase